MKGFGGFESWDETYVHTKHNEKDRTVLEDRERRDGQGAVDLGAHARQGPRLLHRLGPRRAHLGQPRVSRTWSSAASAGPAARTRATVPGVRRTSPGDDRSAARTSSRSSTSMAKVPFYPAGERWGTTAEPISKMQKPLAAGRVDEALRAPGRFRGEAVRERAELRRQADRMNWDERGRLWVGETVDYPNEMQPRGRRAATASSSAKTPTATAWPTSSPSSPTSSASRPA